MDEATHRHLSTRLDFHAEKLKAEQAAWADYQYRKAHPWYGLAADLLDGLDSGLTEVLRMIGIDRPSRAEREAADALVAGTWAQNASGTPTVLRPGSVIEVRSLID